MSRLSVKKTLANAWKSFKAHYFTNVLVVFLVGIIVGGYTLTTNNARIGTTRSADSVQTQAVISRMSGKSNAEIIKDLVEGLEIVHFNTNPESVAEKYTEGVISVFANQVSDSGSVGFGILNGINTLVFKGSVSRSVVIFVLVLILLAVNIFVRNIFVVGRARYFLEQRRYYDTRVDTLLHVYRYGKTKNVARIMFLRYLYQLMWNFTIIGGVIKGYEYSMIPYILAENPTIGARECFRLSKEMTRGNKRKMFANDGVYAIGFILSSFTYNLLATFLISPLRECAYADMYMELRQAQLDNNISKSEVFNDRLLAIANCTAGIYPENTYPLIPLSKREWIKIDYDRKYSVSTLIMFFFTFSLVGWLWEVFYNLLNEGRLVNRGTLFGPWLPIYGFGGLMIIILLKPLRKHPFKLFMAAFVVCGILEYLTAWGLETLFHTKWWDYTGFFLNIHGRVCLEGLFVFGLAGVAFTYLFAPMLDNLYSNVSVDKRKPIIIILLALFAADVCWSSQHPNVGDGITRGTTDNTIQSELTQN